MSAPDRTRLFAGRLGEAELEVWTVAGARAEELEDPALVLHGIPPDVPALGRGPGGRLARPGEPWRLSWSFPPGTSLYGAGEVAGPLERTGRRIVFWNTDAWCYDETFPSLYQSHPWVLALRADGTAQGLLAATPWRGSADFAAGAVTLELEGPPPAVFCLHGRARAVLVGLAELCGRAPMPPLWALGYHQCRWSYPCAAEVLHVAREFRRRRIPCDAIWLDIDWMNRFRVLAWSPERFPRPRRLMGRLHELGLRGVAIVDPGVAVAPDFELYQELLAGGHALLGPRGEPARGQVWPGACHFPDFARSPTRAWWSWRIERFARDAELDGLWCDMNEPSVFDGPGKTLPADCRHRGLAGGGSHARFHALYGQLMAESTRAGLARARPGARPFVLTRAGHLGTARHAATWTGDNRARWEDLCWSIPMVLSLGISGQPFAGPDAGGFVGDPDPELFARWFELAAWLPFFRGHSEKSAGRKEPWSFGPEVETRVRCAIETRMRMLPVWYTLLREAATTGLPPCRPLFLADPADARLRTADDAFLVGQDLLVAPALRPAQTTRRVLLPAVPGGWFRFHPDGPAGAPQTEPEIEVPTPAGPPPVFARAGSIVPVTGSAAHTTHARWEPLWLHVFPDREGRASGRLFEDAGDGHGPWLDARLAARVDGTRLTWSETREGIGAPGGGPTLWIVHGPRRLGARREGPRPESGELELAEAPPL